VVQELAHGDGTARQRILGEIARDGASSSSFPLSASFSTAAAAKFFEIEQIG
jgi:hypothetical protein